MKYGIFVGAEAKAIKAAVEGISNILNSDNGDEVKRIALRILEKATATPSLNSISNCSVIEEAQKPVLPQE